MQIGINTRQVLLEYISRLSDTKLQAIYTLLERDIEEITTDYSDTFKDELRNRYAEYEVDGIAVSSDEVLNGLKKIVAAKSNK